MQVNVCINGTQHHCRWGRVDVGMTSYLHKNYFWRENGICNGGRSFEWNIQHFDEYPHEQIVLWS